MAMKSPLPAFASAAVACLLSVVAFAGDHAHHPLIGEPPAPMHVRTPSDSAVRGSVTKSLWGVGQKEDLVASLVGLSVYDEDEAEIGDVTGVLFAGDGGVDTLLIRMGEASAVAGQDVALPFDLVTTATGSDGRTVIVVETDGQEIAGAIPFVAIDEVPPMSGDE